MTLFSFDSQEPLDHSDLVEATSNAATNDNDQPLGDIGQAEKNVLTLRIGAKDTSAASETIDLSTVINLHSPFAKGLPALSSSRDPTTNFEFQFHFLRTYPTFANEFLPIIAKFSEK